MKIAALGRTQFLYDVILALQEQGHEIVVIGTSPAAPEYSRTEADFASLAQRLGCGYFCQARLTDPKIQALLVQSQAEIGVSINWQTLIPRSILALFPHGVLNSHLGDLPRYRGNACPNWAILNGETEVVLTAHLMDEGLDSGPIVAQRRLALTEQTYIADVYRFTEDEIPGLMVAAVAGLQSGRLHPRPQPQSPASSLRCFPRMPEDGWLDWRQPARQLARIVRASAEPFAGAFTCFQDQRLTIWRARPAALPYPWCGHAGHVAEVNRQRGEVAVLTGQDVLVLQEVSLGEGKRQRASDVLTSLRLRLGADPVAQLLRLEERIHDLEGRSHEIVAHVGAEV